MTINAKSPFGESHVNSPDTPRSPAEESSVLSCSPSKQRNHDNSNNISSINSGSFHPDDSLNTKSRSTVDNSSLKMALSNGGGDDLKENQQHQHTVPHGITTDSEETNNVSVITIENPFEKFSKTQSPTEETRNQIEVVTVENDESFETTGAAHPKEEKDSNQTQEVQNPFDQLLEETAAETLEETPNEAEDPSKSEDVSDTRIQVGTEEKDGIAAPDGNDAKAASDGEGLTIEPVSGTPRALYLRAIQQTAAKCKTMVTTPKEIVTGPNPTPKSAVSAQMKRVLEGQDCQAESPDGSVQWISSQKQQQRQEFRSAFDIALKKQGDTPERDTNPTYNSSAAASYANAPFSAFHTFQTIAEQDDCMKAMSSDELSVKEEVLDGTDSSYLQLDVESVASMHTFDIDEKTKPPPAPTPLVSLRSSLSMIFNTGKAKAKNKDDVKASEDIKDKEAVPTNQKSSSDPMTAVKNDTSTLDSLFKASLGMMGIGKTRSTKSSASSSKDTGGDVEMASKPALVRDGSSARKSSSTSRGRLLSEEDSESNQRERLPMGSQYLDRGRSPVRERTVTPVPAGDSLEVDDIMECDGSNRSASYDSMDDIWVNTRRTPGKNNKNVNMSFYYSSPKTIKSVNTSETEDSFIKAAINAQDTNKNAVVTYNEGYRAEKRSWQPPEHEDKERDTMIRAVMERPELVAETDKEQDNSRSRNCTNFRRCILIALAMLVAITAVTGCLFCGITGKCTARDDKPNRLEPEEEVLPLVLDLPMFTQDSLRSYHTPQAKAYLWLENDPYHSYYSDARKIQRFALASIYFSTKIAQNWTQSHSWLDYDVHECFWFSHVDDPNDLCEGDEYKRLILPKNNLRGNLPPEIALLTSLVEIDLSRNVLFGPIPTQVGLLTSLEKLWLEKNELNELPSEIGALSNLQNISISTNDLKGSIPSEVGRLTNLVAFRLFYNFLEGSLPTEVGLLTNLEIFDVDVNHLSGTIPSQIGELRRLKELWLDWNSFVGPLPTQLGLLTSLEKLYLGRAFIDIELRDEDWRGSGDYSIPNELGQLSNLQELYLDNNGLTGLIPEELSSLTNLETATLDGNLLTDSIAPGICDLFDGELESLSVDCSAVLCTCGCTCVAD